MSFDLIVFFCFFANAAAGFLYGQPCSERNTAYLHPKGFTIPKNETNCVDLTQAGTFNDFPDFFQLVRNADTVYIDHMNLDRFPSAIIYGFPKLEMIDLSGNDIRRLPYKIYKIAPKLNKLLLPDNALIVPKKRPLLKSDTIETLMLSRNRINNIYQITFAKVPNLKVLFLDGNRLKRVSPEMFAPIQGLLYLHIGANAIEEVPPRASLPPLLRSYISKDQKVIIK